MAEGSNTGELITRVAGTDLAAGDLAEPEVVGSVWAGWRNRRRWWRWPPSLFSLPDFEADQKSVLECLRDLEALRGANRRGDANEADVPCLWEPPGDPARIEQIESIPAEEIRERVQTRRAMLKRNIGPRKN